MLTRTARLSAILSSTLEAAVIFDRTMIVRAWNDRAELSFGWTEEETRERNVIELLTSMRDGDTLRGQLECFVKAGGTRRGSGQRGLLTLRHKNGRELPVEIGLMLAGSTREELFVAFIRDRSAVLAAESQARARSVELSRTFAQKAAVEGLLEETEELYRHTVELSTLIPWMADATGRALWLGEPWTELTGMTLADTLRAGWAAIHPDDAPLTMTSWNYAIRHHERFDTEYRMRTADGSFCWVHARAAPHFDQGGVVTRWYGTLENIDDRKLAETALQLVQAELIHVSRVSAMGAMASTLAHELNQPLTAITNFVRGSIRALAMLDGEPVEAIRQALAEADESAMRASEIIRSLRALVTKGEVLRRVEDLPTLIHEACRIALVDTASLGISCQLELDRNAALVSVDRVQIQQVLVNLLRNAVEALRESERREIVITTRVVSEECSQLSVRDSGPGVSVEPRERLFQTFNTTKQNGMGLGLSISRTIIEAHSGQIWYEAGPTGGAIFHLLLPRR